MATNLKMQLLLRRAAFEDSCVLALGEPGYHTSTKEFKIGDGSTTWAELPIANKAQIDALIKVVDDKVAALGNTYATDEEVRIIKEALEAAIAAKVSTETYTADKATFALKTDVATEFAKYTTTTDQQLIDAEQDRRLGLVESELDTHGDIVTHHAAEFATAAQGQKADAAAVKADVDAALSARYTKTEADAKFETIANVDLVRNDITNITKTDGLIATAKSEAIASAKTETQNQIATFKTTVVDPIDGRLGDVESQLANVSNVMDFIGAGATLPAVEASNKGDVFVINEGEDAGKEYVFDGTAWVEFGYATGNENAIAALKDRMDTAEEDIDALETAVEDHETRLDAIEPKVEGWDTTKSTVDANKSTWDKAGTAVQSSDFESFKTSNTAAIEAAQKAGEDAAAAVAEDLAEYIDGKSMSDADLKKYADDAVSTFNTNTVSPIAARVKAIEDAPYTTKKYVDDQDASILQQAKEYANSLDHEDTTYVVAATDNALEFTVTPTGKGSAQTIKLVAPTVDTGVMKVSAGTDIVVTPVAGTGDVTVAHKAYTTGTVKDASHDSETDPSFITGIAIENGHVTGATVRNLADVLEAIEFILDCGTAAV